MNDKLYNILNTYAITKQNTNTDGKYGTHMPYVFYDKDNKKKLLFDVLINNCWKLHIYDFESNEILQMSTPSSNEINTNECNPTIYIDNKGKYVLSYMHAPFDTGVRTTMIRNWY